MDILDELQNDAEVFRGRPIGFTIQRAIDEIDRLRSLTTWQPIETAPKDGTWVVGIHKDRTEGIAAMRFVKPHWMTATGNSARPTHWLPLPTPPEADT